MITCDTCIPSMGRHEPDCTTLKALQIKMIQDKQDRQIAGINKTRANWLNGTSTFGLKGVSK